MNVFFRLSSVSFFHFSFFHFSHFFYKIKQIFFFFFQLFFQLCYMFDICFVGLFCCFIIFISYFAKQIYSLIMKYTLRFVNHLHYVTLSDCLVSDGYTLVYVLVLTQRYSLTFHFNDLYLICIYTSLMADIMVYINNE